jgi:NAD(P)-dependent dehydrogenase (short-subunit alcohol dehydrogenase family)
MLFLVQKALPLLADGGAIVLNSSIANVKGLPGASAYSALKAAVRASARTWTIELKERRIRVNIVSPALSTRRCTTTSPATTRRWSNR